MTRPLRIFISSPGDVPDERLRAGLVIDKLAQEFRRHVAFEVIRWEHEPLCATGVSSSRRMTRMRLAGRRLSLAKAFHAVVARPRAIIRLASGRRRRDAVWQNKANGKNEGVSVGATLSRSRH